jgi:oligopeptide/dipeptide ABC transporter ATP-binding protein
MTPEHGSPTDVILEVEGLVKYFPGSRAGFLDRGEPRPIRAVDGVDFFIRRGETLALVGESGCGKSTIARTLVRLVEPTAGSARYLGEDLFAADPGRLRMLRREIQMVFQDPYASLNPRMTVAEIVGEGWDAHPDVIAGRDRDAVLCELLERVGLPAAARFRYPHQFSGGQRQRIGIARALALEPQVLICDEPVSALDVSVQAQVVNLITDIQRDSGVAVLFIAHDLAVVRHIADRVAVMYLGRIVETGTEDQVYNEPTHPYTQALLSAIPAPDLDVDRSGRIVLTGEVPSPSNPPSGCAFRTRCWLADDRCAVERPTLDTGAHLGHPSACFHAARST